MPSPASNINLNIALFTKYVSRYANITFIFLIAIDIEYEVFERRSLLFLLGFVALSNILHLAISQPNSLQKWRQKVIQTISPRIKDQYLKISQTREYKFIINNFSIIAISTLIITGSFIRLHEISGLPPYPDEYYHLIAAREIYDSSKIIHVPPYSRGLIPVTVPVYLSFLFTEPRIWPARVVITIFSTLTVIPLYLLLERVNKTTAIIGGFLYITSPWAIAISRTVREYAVFPFYFLSLSLLTLKLLDHLGKKIVLKDLIKNKKVLLYIMVIISSIIYALVVDPKSTFIAGLGFYGVFGMLFVSRIDFSNENNMDILKVLIIPFVVIFLYAILNQDFITIIPEYNGGFLLDLFYNDPSQQWYNDQQVWLAIIIIISGMLYSIQSKNITAVFSSVTLISYFYLFAFHFARYTRPRYAFYIEIWYIIVFAIGIYALSNKIYLIILK